MNIIQEQDDLASEGMNGTEHLLDAMGKRGGLCLIGRSHGQICEQCAQENAQVIRWCFCLTLLKFIRNKEEVLSLR